MDVHVPQAITDQLRRRGVDVLTAIEDDGREWADDEVLERARLPGRMILRRMFASSLKRTTNYYWYLIHEFRV